MKRLLRRALVFIASVLTISAQAQDHQSGNGTTGATTPDWENPAVLRSTANGSFIGVGILRKDPPNFTVRIST